MSIHVFYVPGTNMIGSAAWQNASINTVNTYDQYKRLTNIAVNGANVYGYILNDKNQRTSATLPDGNKWNYTYDVMGQLTGAVKQDTAKNPLANMNYFYDLIGNRTSATENSATTTYTSNLVNQYTVVNAIVPVYDLDGNMTSYNGWTYTYNGENRLVVAENAADGVRVEADYDYMGRRLFKKVYNSNTLVKHSVFVYDGFKQIAEFDALNNNSLKASYLWQPGGLDVVLLRNSEYLIADGNKNIIQVRNATESVTDSYVYDPFGKVAHNGTSENPFQFSSEFYDNEIGFIYYNYRYYMPNLGRWINRDPLCEQFGEDMYAICTNSICNMFDALGLRSRATGGHHIIPWKYIKNEQLFSDAAAKYLNSKDAMVYVPPRMHNYTRPHPMYNRLVGQYVYEMHKRVGRPLSSNEAKQLLGQVNSCEFIKEFNKVVPRGQEAVRKWFMRDGIMLLPDEMRGKIQTIHKGILAKKIPSAMRKTVSKLTKVGLNSISTGYMIYIIIQMKEQNQTDAEISIAVYDELTWGLGSFAKKKYREYAESVAESAMENAFPHLKDIDNPLPPNNNRYPVYNYGLPKDDKKILSPIDAFL